VLFEAGATLLIQQYVNNKIIDLTWSYVLKYENDNNPIEVKRKGVDVWRKLSTVYVSKNDDVTSLAQNIVECGFDAYDSLHIACAIHAKCNFFHHC
jgi:predicted nucleic acid-binding protein